MFLLSCCIISARFCIGPSNYKSVICIMLRYIKFGCSTLPWINPSISYSDLQHICECTQWAPHRHCRGWIGPSFASPMRWSCSCGIWPRGTRNRTYWFIVTYWIYLRWTKFLFFSSWCARTHDCWCICYWILIQVKGQGIYAFVTLLEDVEYSNELRKALINAVRSQVMTH